MKNGKSHGIDGLPCEFFKLVWDTVVDDLCCMAKDDFLSGTLIASHNQGLIELIPKNATQDSIGQWRPITLIIFFSKILVKALASRIRRVASRIVRQEQMGFVQGIFILNTMISAWESMEWAKETG